MSVCHVLNLGPQLPNVDPDTGIADPALPYKVIAKYRRVDPEVGCCDLLRSPTVSLKRRDPSVAQAHALLWRQHGTHADSGGNQSGRYNAGPRAQQVGELGRLWQTHQAVDCGLDVGSIRCTVTRTGCTLSFAYHGLVVSSPDNAGIVAASAGASESFFAYHSKMVTSSQ